MLSIEKQDNTAVVTITTGELNVNNVKAFKKAIEPVLTDNMQVIIDLGQLNFVDSSGLGAFLHCMKQLNSKNGDLKLCSISKSVRILFEMVRLHQIISIYSTQEEALRSLEQQQS